MYQSAFDTTPAAVPAHVPAALVRDFDFRNDAMFRVDPHRAFLELTADAPDIFFAPQHGGYWVMKRFEDIRYVCRTAELFTSCPASIPALVGRPRPMAPIEIDPPLHRRYRMVLGRMFAPAAVKVIEPRVRALAAELIEGFAARGQVEFVREFAAELPVRVFLQVIGVSESEAPRLRHLHHAMFSGATVEEQQRAGAEVNAFLQQTFEDKRRNPDDGVLSALMRAEPDGGAYTQEELVDLGFQLFTAGLDTVTNSLGMTWRYLAEHPERQAEIRARPELIPTAIDELLRYTAIVSTTRRLTRDIEYKGVTMKQGEAVLLPLVLANHDPSIFPASAQVTFERAINNHLTFGAGVHRCLGSHLARLEMIIVAEEWFRRIPAFRVAPGEELITHGGPIQGVVRLPLEWEPAT